ncbi:MAG: YigZ family protein [Bacilli bacterium]
MVQPYYMVKSSSETETVIERSRFITHVSRAYTESEAQAFIARIKKEHWSATHNCSCYLIGDRDEFQKANDDGEPSGTAGMPMLEVLRKKGLKNTVVVVTRYFGGIKLGAGGLIRAYAKSTVNGIKSSGTVERKQMQRLFATVDYTWVGKMENFLAGETGMHVVDVAYSDVVCWTLDVELDDTDISLGALTELTNGRAKLEVGEQLYSEVDVILPESEEEADE